MERIYIRTDRNGTKYYHDWTCDRCGGAGFSDKWLHTGRVCYQCGGSGRLASPRTVKVYTEEYIAKMQAKNAEKIKENGRKLVEKNFAELGKQFAQLGCNSDGIGYVLKGNTYPVKEQIKENGGKWILGAWVCPVAVEAEGVIAVRIDMSGCVNEYGCVEDNEDIIWKAIRS